MPDIVCFEKQDDWGGQWNFTWRTGTDKYGEPVHTSMYRNLWLNGPKEVLEFAEYIFDDHFDRPVSSYPPRAVLWDYIAGRAEQSEVRHRIRFATVVRWVEYHEGTETFSVSVQNLRTGETDTSEFDYVILCTGYLHHYPFLPSALAMDSPNNVYPDTLYRGVVREGNDRLFYLGARDQWLTFNMFDAQAWFVRDVIMGRITLPDAAARRRSMDEWLERLHGLETDGDQIDFRVDYVRDLITLTDYPMFDLDDMLERYLAIPGPDPTRDVLTGRVEETGSVR